MSFNFTSLISSHDKKLLPLFITIIVMILLTPHELINSIIKMKLFNTIFNLNPFVVRMANESYEHDFAYFCYGITFLITPYFFCVLLKSRSLKDGVEVRYKKGGRTALLISALATLLVFIGMFFYFKDFSPERVSAINYLMFYSHIGVVVFSVLLTYFCVLMLVCFFMYFSQFLKKGN